MASGLKRDIKIPSRDELSLECGGEFNISVTYSVKVESCNNYSDDEQERMLNGIMRKWLVDASAHCEALSDCQSPEFIGFDPGESRCTDEDGESIWTQTVLILGKCAP